MISIVLPTYNGEKYIKQSIDSVLKQSIDDWELIIVDDCSIDNTPQIVEEYRNRDSRIQVIRNAQNKKLPGSLNIGFKKAKGELFTWTSDDNAYAPNALERLKNCIENTEADFIYSNYKFIDPEDFIIGDMKTGPSEMLQLIDNIGACFLYKREIHEELNGYDVNKFYVEDYDFWLRAYRKFVFFHLDEYLYYYRIQPSALSWTHNEEVQRKTIELLKENIKYVKDKELKEKIQNKINSFGGM